MVRPGVGFRLLALAASLAAWALVALGGVVRITESGLGCPDWPLCKGNVVPAEQKAPIVEYSHRATAAVVSALVFAVAVAAARRYRSRPDLFLPAVGTAALVPFQALLGAVVVWLELPSWIVGFHFVVGMLFLGATVLTVAAAWLRPPRAAPSRRFVQLAWTSAAVGLALVAAGAAVVSAGADGACGEQWPACNGSFVAGGGAAIQVVHRSLAYLVAALALALVALAWRREGPLLAAWLPLAAVLGQMSIGVALVLAGDESRFHQVLEGLHVAGAGVVWASLVALVVAARRPRRTAAPGPVSVGAAPSV